MIATSRRWQSIRKACSDDQRREISELHHEGTGGSAWESNPPRRAERHATGFEDQGAHRDPTTPGSIVVQRGALRVQWPGDYPAGVPSSLLLGLAVFAVGVDAYIVAAVLPEIADNLHEPIERVGLLASAYALPMALLAPVFGPLSDRRGRRFALRLGLAIFAAAAAACVVAPSLPLLLVTRAINGLGAAIILPAAIAKAGDLPTEAERGRAIGLLGAMFPLSTLIGLPIGAALTIAGGWRAPFAFIALVGLIAIAGVGRLPADHPTGQPIGYLDSLRSIVRDRQAQLIMVVTFLWFGGAFGLFVYVGEFVHRSFKIPADRAGLVYVVVGLVGIIAARTSGRFITTIGPRRTVLIGLSMFAAAVLVLPLTTVALPLALLVFAIWAFGTWLGIPAINTIVAGLSEQERGMRLAFNSSAQSLSNVVGPIITGAIIANWGFGVAGPYTSLLAVCTLLLAWAVLPKPASTASKAVADRAPIIET
jgi:predicted MFS family arabinose efflux permease